MPGCHCQPKDHNGIGSDALFGSVRSQLCAGMMADLVKQSPLHMGGLGSKKDMDDICCEAPNSCS